MGRREGDATLNSLGSGWFRFREWFVFALDGLLEALVWVVWLVWSGLVWFGLAVLSSGGGVVTRSVSVCSFVRFVLYAVYSTRSVLSLRAFWY